MRDKVGEIFEAQNFRVANFGIFVTLGRYPYRRSRTYQRFGRRLFQLPPRNHGNRSERSGIRFNMGDRLPAKVARADGDDGKIDFVPIAERSGRGRKVKSSASAKPNRDGGESGS